ncbi:Nif11-like leader peptide family natural product precursor [Actinoallomurus sp. CA-150999]|uniref:Nif11-like leader peptide family natural product precursor n=1 Tax=Actinoallomurus sp. CA-150999 TaxID=3239887 RepID=UPI003D8AED22
MSVEAGQAFLQIAYGTPELSEQLRAMTGVQELVRLGSRHGYTFTVPELMEASSSTVPAPGPETGRRAASATATRDTRADVRPGPTPTRILHHEFRLADLPGFDGVAEQLPDLKIKPSSVDMGRFKRTFREEDIGSTDQSPADPKYRAWHEERARTGWRDPAVGPDAPRRDFHLINLDEHVDHPGYDRYFAAKRRTIAALEAAFATEVRFSGSLWYPPQSYRLWHTNETQPGWRMYLVDFDEPFPDPAETSFFRYMNPHTEEIVTLRESPGTVRFFRAEQDPARLFWHCIVNPTTRHRWSFGFVVPDDWMARLSVRA